MPFILETECAKPTTWTEAQEAQRDGWYGPARDYYLEVLTRYPEHVSEQQRADALFAAAICDCNLEDYPEAFARLRAILGRENGRTQYSAVNFGAIWLEASVFERNRDESRGSVELLESAFCRIVNGGRTMTNVDLASVYRDIAKTLTSRELAMRARWRAATLDPSLQNEYVTEARAFARDGGLHTPLRILDSQLCLLDAMPDLESVDANGATPLQAMAVNPDTRGEVQSLLQAGADASARMGFAKRTAMMRVIACPQTHSESLAGINLFDFTFMPLVKHGVALDAQDRGGRTALHYLVSDDRPTWYRAGISALVDAGAKVDIKDAHGKRPVDYLGSNEIPSIRNCLTPKLSRLQRTPSAGGVVGHYEGERTWPNGARYKGQLRAGLPHGRGLYTWPNGAWHEGQYVGGRACGQGERTWSDGCWYKGNFSEGLPHGEGVHTRPDGEQYEGKFEAGLPHGYGVLRWPNGEKYEGDFRAGREQGDGVYTWPGGGQYVGKFFAGEQDGPGIFTWPDGSQYKCEFQQGSLRGQGKFVAFDGTVRAGL